MLTITQHDGGFFSCTTVKLYKILEYLRGNRKLPLVVNSCGLFNYYKPSNYKATDDISNHFFQLDRQKTIQYEPNVRLNLMDHIKPLKDVIKFEKFQPFIEKYFTPTEEIFSLVKFFETKYNIDYNNTCGVYYRGTDKCTETTISEYTFFYDKMKAVAKEDSEANGVNPDFKFLLLTDTGPFIDVALKFFDNLIIIEENNTSYDGKCLHINTEKENNYKQIKIMFALVIILSRCKYVIVPSSNVSYWIALYRKNCNNLYQALENSWY